MAPEKYITDSDILPEAERIADALLEVQGQVNATADTLHEELLGDIRGRLGYEEAGPSTNNMLVDTNIEAKHVVVTPRAVATVLPLSARSADTTQTARNDIARILSREDDRLLVVTGPCSIHDTAAALEYAEHVQAMRDEYGEELEIVMRAYTEKPRTELGWKGFAYDPYLDGSNRFSVGLVATRMLLCRITDMGVPVAAEPLNALTPQYVNGLVVYSGVGARNVTDQTSRERASGASAIVGFKNSPEGSILAAVEAVTAARSPHDFLGIDEHGMTMQVVTTGNQTAHVILRGDQHGPNYSSEHIARARRLLQEKGLPVAVVVDASHDNSQKQPQRQIEVVRDLSRQLRAGETALRGVMIESNLVAGKQAHSINVQRELTYGQSITDGCVNVDTTHRMLESLAAANSDRRIAA